MRRVIKKLAIIGMDNAKLAEFSDYSTWLWLTILGRTMSMDGIRIKRDNTVNKFDLWHKTEVPLWVYESRGGTHLTQHISTD